MQKTRKPVGVLIADLARIQRERGELDAAAQELRTTLRDHMIKRNLQKIAFGDHVVSLKTRHNWSYSADLERDMLQVRQSQKWEQLQGIATDAPTPYISLTDA